MDEVIKYQLFWRSDDDHGVFQLALANGTGATLDTDSAAEASLILDILRNEKPVYFEHGMLITGFEPTGGGD